MSDPLDVDRLAERVADLLVVKMRLEAERLINLKELAKRVGLSRRGASGMVARNELPPGVLIGGCRRWDWEQVKTWLAGRAGRRPRRGRGRFARSAETRATVK